MRTTLVLFDIDGTLTVPRTMAEPRVLEFLAAARSKFVIGVVGGSDLAKQKDQLGENVLELFDYNFPENGLVAFKNGIQIGSMSIQEHFGEDNLKRIINFALRYISELDIPIKRGTFIEFRTAMINISPIGRNCSRQERIDFEAYDKIHNIRPQMIAQMKAALPDLDLIYSLGGQISFDVFPRGWDKTVCLRYLTEFEGPIHFFGDKTYETGNDYEIFTHPRVIGHTVLNPDDTMRQVSELN